MIECYTLLDVAIKYQIAKHYEMGETKKIKFNNVKLPS